MNKLFTVLALLLIPFFILSCAKKEESDDSASSSPTTESYSRTNTPAKSTVGVPGSLSAGSSSSRTANADCEGCDNAMLYSQIKGAVQMMKHSVSSADLNLIVADVKMSDGVTSGECLEQGEWSITFTREIYNALVKMEEEFGGEEGAENSNATTYKQFIGQSIKPPIAFKYSTTSEGGYAHELKVAESCAAISSGTGAETFRWDSQKTKLLSQFEDTMGSSSFKGTIAFDDNTDKSVVNMKFSDGSQNFKQTLNLAECTTDQSSGMTGDCAIFSITTSFSSSGETFMIKGSGKADDNGGYGQGSMSAQTSSDNISMQYKEAWDKTGALTYLAMCPEKYTWNGTMTTTDCSVASNWHTMGGEADSTYQEDSYSAQAYTVNGVSSLANGSYHLVISGKNPNNNPETIVGYGEIRGKESFWDFWGADSSGSFDVYTIGSSSMTDSGTDATVAAN